MGPGRDGWTQQGSSALPGEFGEGFAKVPAVNWCFGGGQGAPDRGQEVWEGQHGSEEGAGGLSEAGVNCARRRKAGR